MLLQSMSEVDNKTVIFKFFFGFHVKLVSLDYVYIFIMEKDL